MKKLCLLLLSTLLLSGCFNIDEEPNTPQGNLQALWTIIDEHYCFLDYKGIDWADVRQRYISQVSNNTSNQQLFEIMTTMLSELKDGHVNLYTSADVARYWHWYEDYPRGLDEELRTQLLGSDYRIAGSLKYKILDDNTGYLQCASFSSSFSDTNIDEILYYLRSCNGLIIDVRGNTGGILTLAERLASHFTNDRLLVGYVTYKKGKGHNDFAEPMAEYLEPSTGVRWQKPVVILTNRECYSACNIFVRDMLCCTNVRTLGDQTGGGSGMPFSSELPNGWGVRFSASPSFDANMQQIEFGIQPTEQCALDPNLAAQGFDSIIQRAQALLAE